jgi:hypothetical protein
VAPSLNAAHLGEGDHAAWPAALWVLESHPADPAMPE